MIILYHLCVVIAVKEMFDFVKAVYTHCLRNALDTQLFGPYQHLVLWNFVNTHHQKNPHTFSIS